MTEQKLPARSAVQPAATRCQNRKTGSTFAIWSGGFHTVWRRTLVRPADGAIRRGPSEVPVLS